MPRLRRDNPGLAVEAVGGRQLAGFFLFEGHGHIGIGAEPHHTFMDIRDQATRNEMMMALMRAVAAILPRELDAVADDMVDSADMHTVRADDFGMVFYLAEIGHGVAPLLERPG
jgi:hypothetical protein